MISLDSGDKIQGDTTTASQVDFTISGLDANAIKQLADGQLANSIGDIYTADSADVVTTITLVNTNTSAEAVNLYLTPSGGTARRIIPKDFSLTAQNSLHTDGKSVTVVSTTGVVSSYAAHKASHETAGTDEINDVDINAGTIDGVIIGGAAACTFTGSIQVFDAGGETISGDGTDLTIASGGLINLTATSDVVIPVNIGLHLGDGAEKLESNNTDLTINSGGELNLTASSDVVIPVNIGLHLGDGAEKLESNNTDLTINSGGDIALTATNDINIPVNVGLEFAGTEKIESDGTDLSITVGATGDINIGADIGVTFGNDGEKIEGNGTDLTIAGNNINLTAVADIVVPANVGVTFGTGEKIEGDSTDLTVTSGGAINLTAVTDVVVPANVGVTFGTGEKIEGDNTDLTVTSGADIALAATGDVNIPANVGVTFGDDGEKIEGDGTDLSIASSNLLNLTATGGVVLNSFMQLIENAGITLDAAISADEKYCGIVEAGTAGATLNFGDCVYHDVTAGEWLLAKADVTATSGAVKLGINVTVAQVADGNAMTVLLWGKIRSDADYAFTVDAPVFISAATAGDLTPTRPTGTTNFVVRIAGYGNTADELFFCPDSTYLELA